MLCYHFGEIGRAGARVPITVPTVEEYKPGQDILCVPKTSLVLKHVLRQSLGHAMLCSLQVKYAIIVLGINVFLKNIIKKKISSSSEIECNNSVLGSSDVYLIKIVSEYDQEIPQSQTADNLMAPRGRATQLSRDTRKTN